MMVMVIMVVLMFVGVVGMMVITMLMVVKSTNHVGPTLWDPSFCQHFCGRKALPQSTHDKADTTGRTPHSLHHIALGTQVADGMCL